MYVLRTGTLERAVDVTSCPGWSTLNLHHTCSDVLFVLYVLYCLEKSFGKFAAAVLLTVEGKGGLTREMVEGKLKKLEWTSAPWTLSTKG